MDITTQILGVQGRTTRTNKVVYDVQIVPVAELPGVAKVSAWEQADATKAQTLAGQVATLRVEQKVAGNNVYYNLKEIAGPGEQLSTLALPGVAGGIPTQNPQYPQNPSLPGTFAPGTTIPMAAPQGGDNFQRRKHPDDESRIVRQNVLGTAFGFAGSLFQGAGPEAYEEALTLAMSLAKLLYETVGGTPQPTAVQQPTTPAEIAATVPGVQVGTEGLRPW